MGRLHIPGGIYHTIGRGLESRNIFDSSEDKRDFLHRLETNLGQFRAQCLAWVLMSNHYHLLIRVSDIPLSKLMAPVLTGFAGNYNRRKERNGYVFQNRFQSILCGEESYFLELVRYIHLNPLRAGILNSIEELDKYAWTGHAAMMGVYHCDFLSTDEVLNHFGDKLKSARRKYRQFLGRGLDSKTYQDYSGGGIVRSYEGWEELAKLRRKHIVCIGDERILGSSDFVEAALSQDKISTQKHTLRLRQGWNFNLLHQKICQLFAVAEEDLYKKARSNNTSDAKTLLCYWAVEELGMPVAKVSCLLDMSQQAVSKRVKKGSSVCLSRDLNFEDLELSC